MKYPSSFKSKKYPKFIRESVFTLAYPKPSKVFPKLGLKNNSINIKSLNFSADDTYTYNKIYYEDENNLELFTNKNIKIHFSSTGPRGYWDIATMSMRGIQSCMSWSNENAKSLVGSLIDPCTSIIYITNNTNTKYGKRMIARSVVRLVCKRIHNKLQNEIFIEESYINHNFADLAGNFDTKELAYDIFSKYIKTFCKLPITDNMGNSCFIPLSSIMNTISEVDTDRGWATYSDAELQYGNIPSNSKIAKLLK